MPRPPRPKRRLPWWFHLIRNAVPLAWLLAFVLVVHMLLRFGWWWAGERIGF